MIKTVEIYYHNSYRIHGFQFFDKDQTLLWSTGMTFTGVFTSVILAENEAIIGFVAKIRRDNYCHFTDF